jgi:hypothetical protein
MTASLVLATSLVFLSQGPSPVSAIEITAGAPFSTGLWVAISPPRRTQPGTSPSAGSAEARDLIAKRKFKKNVRYRTSLQKEAAEAQALAKAQADAKSEYKEALPYMVQAQGQLLNRQSQLEANQIQAQRNAILNQFLNGGGYQGIIVGPLPAPPRIVNTPGQPLTNP